MLSAVQGSLRPQRPRRTGRRIGPEEAGMADLLIGCPDETTTETAAVEVSRLSQTW